ncbi:hypothetical protein D9757_007640 [Collybiopsis confluens]|uniref:Cytochrome P450 n=1 Tax=Collybiopsis confluens TaxID=2823264 RepID=A0A8H5M2W5_9AGAR|nr:hypothetical protein D9757_007640 [Collybiopsis confluens]
MFGTFTLILLGGVFVLQGLSYLFRHPLNRFPGPRLAKWTSWYRAYYDLVGQGAWVRQLEILHARYGSIVRVGPNEEAAAMRSLLASYFSRRAVIRRETVIREKILKFISRLKSFHIEYAKPVSLNRALQSASLDILTSVIFSQSFNVLDSPAFEHPFVYHRKTSVLNIWITKYLPTPVLAAFTRLIPRIDLAKDAVVKQCNIIRKEFEITQSDSDDAQADSNNTLFHYLLRRIQELLAKPATSATTSARLEELLKPSRLIGEGINARFAGADTVANACIVGVRHLLINSDILKRLVEELDNAWPAESEPSYEELEKLPYLTAVIKESLRLSHGVVSPLGRVVGPGEAVIAGEQIPPGTNVGISATFVHLNPELFPDPAKFKPERWLDRAPRVENTTEINSDRYLVSFSRGPRACVGIHLAWCELYLIFGMLFRKLELNLVNVQDLHGPLCFDDFFTPIFTGNPPLVFVKERES